MRKFSPHKSAVRMLILALLVFAGTVTGFAEPSSAQPGGQAPVVIRDTEIENILHEWTAPVIKAAGLDPQAVNIILVQNRDLNAFVAGGPNVFIYTGLLDKSENAGEVIGVIAHELGHIRGGHLVRTRTAMENASYESILGALLGVGAAIISGDGGVGAAVATGSQSAALGRFLAFSRVQESSADQAGMSYMEKAGFNPKGLLSFMGKLESQELLPASQQSEYVRTHPLTRDRIEALQAGFNRSANKDQSFPPEWEEQHRRLKAKLLAFISPEQVAWTYDDRDKRIAADYARAIAAYRQNHIDKALGLMDGLLGRERDNPYFLELKGQMLVDFSRVEDSLPYYRRSIEILRDAPLIRAAYAHALIESSEQDKTRLDEAIRQLERAIRDESRSARNYRLLATAYGRTGREPMAKLYLAEEALLKQQLDYAKRQAEGALPGLPEGSPQWLRAQDILKTVELADKKSN